MKKSILLFTTLMLAAAISKAQIPNAGFENWTSMGSYNNPDNWSVLNDMTSSMSAYTCLKGTPGSPGTAYLKLVSKTITGLGVVPGIAVCGTINATTFQAQSGFPFSQRPQNLTGNWQHMIYGSSQGYIDVQLTRWDNILQSRVVVASAHNVLAGMAMSWAGFTIPLTYSDGNNPDSCIIVLAASGSSPANNDYLYVDNLSFTGAVAGISEKFLDANISVYPNPSSEKLTVDFTALKDKKILLEIVDAQGKKVKVIQGLHTSSKATIDISGLTKGNYILNAVADDGFITKNFIIQ